MKRGRVIPLLLLGGAALLSIGIWQPFAMRRDEWIQKTVLDLKHDVSPPSDTTNFLPITEWVLEDSSFQQRGYILFKNGWASIRYHTIHNEDKVGDAAILKTQDGAIYVSDFHFCGGLLDFSHKQQPQDLEEFLKLFGPSQHWKRIP